MSKRFLGSFRLLILCALLSALTGLPGAARASILTRPTNPEDSPVISLRGAIIDTRAGRADGADGIPTGLRQARSADPQFWLIQFAGPIQDAWLDRMQRLGLEIVAYMPDYAYVIWGDGVALDRLDGVTRPGAFVRWTGPYHPAYRLAPALREAIARAQAGAATSEPALVDVTVQMLQHAGPGGNAGQAAGVERGGLQRA